MRDSFKARTTLAVGPQRMKSSACRRCQGRRRVARLPYSLKILLENLLRFEDGVNVTREDIEALLRLGPEGGAQPRNRVHAGARDHAGLHRRARVVDLAAMREAMVTPRRRPAEDQPAGAGRPGHRPLGAGRRVRHGRALAATTAASSSSATASATRSCAGARRRSATSRSCRRAPASCTRSTSSTSAASCSPRTRTASQPRPIPTRWSAPTRTRR